MVWYGKPGDWPVDVDGDVEDDLDLDYSSLFCPGCGSNDVEIIEKLAAKKSWWGSGRGRCNHCGCEFGIALELEEEGP